MAKREHKTPKKKFHIGDITKIQDKNGFLLHTGDKIKYGEYTGRFLLNYEMPCIAPDYSMWYGDDEFSMDSYGKCIYIPVDNGGKMNLEIVEPIVTEEFYNDCCE